MGIGDSIMATAEARYYNELYKRKVVFALDGNVFYEPSVMANNPRIEKDPVSGERYCVIANGPGRRPYIAGGDSKRWYYNTDFKAEPGEIYLLPHERSNKLSGKILIEPYVKETTYSQNKHWPHWAEFVKLAKQTEIGQHLVQFSYDSRPPLVSEVRTNGFRDALGYISGVDFCIVPDGAIHHACAAMNVPCITLWGGLVSPDILGYDTQINVWSGAEACGSNGKCSHCHKAMDDIAPQDVLNAALDLWGQIDAERKGRVATGS